VVHKLVNLEEEVSFISQQFSGNILIFVRVKYIVLAHDCQNALDQVLEPLINDRLNSCFELDAPCILREVIKEILLNFLADKLLRLQDSLIDRIEEGDKHINVEWAEEKLVLLLLRL